MSVPIFSFGLVISVALISSCGTHGSKPPITPPDPSRSSKADTALQRVVVDCPSVRPSVRSDCPVVSRDENIDPEIEAAAYSIRGRLFEQERKAAMAELAVQTAHSEDNIGGRQSDGEDYDSEDVKSEYEREYDHIIAEIDERERCGAMPKVDSFRYDDAEGRPPLVHFSGSFATDAGADPEGWGILTVRVGCEWRILSEGSAPEPNNTPDGDNVLIFRELYDECTEDLSVYRLDEAKLEPLFSVRYNREDREDSGFCDTDAWRRVELIENDDGALIGFRVIEGDKIVREGHWKEHKFIIQ